MDFQQKARQIPVGKPGSVNKGGGKAAFRFLEHTADMGIEAQAPTCDEMFVQAGKAILALLAGHGKANCASREVTFDVAADDLEELLVVWLNELLYLIQAKRVWPQEIFLDGVHSGVLKARIEVVPLEGDLEREIKAVTYHHLLVSSRRGLWRARVYLDV